MEFTKPFSNLSKKDANIAGGKGASLGEMAQAGIPVPDGFVVLSATFDHFLKETDLTQEIDAILKTVDHKAIHTVESASEKIRRLIENQEIPEDIAKEIKEEFEKLESKFVAVRSSATAEDGAEHAWAGQLDSFLNTDNQTLLKNVRRCWSSLFTPRAIFYRFEKELHGTEISVAVVVQKMVQSEISGIAFSVHPITEDHNQLIIEAGFGLGEAIVSGSITPDSYVVEKEPRRIIDINVNTQTRSLIGANSGIGNEWVEIPEPKASSQVLTETQILELANLIIKIENHYGFPCDIEWAFESGKFYIVQSRPITTLSKQVKSSDLRVFEKYYVRDNGILSFQVWDENQRVLWNKLFGWSAPTFLLDAVDGVATVYGEPKIFPEIEKKIAEKLKEPDFLEKFMSDYGQTLDKLEPIWKSRKSLSNKKELLEFFDLAMNGWTGQAMMYFIPTLPEGFATKEQSEIALLLRERASAYLEDTDRIMLLSLKKLYSELGELSRYITLEELRSDSVLDTHKLKKRQEHYIFWEGKVSVNTSLEDFTKQNKIKINTESVTYSDTIKGETAMKGRVSGKVKIVLKKAFLNEVKEGDILVTAMTTPDFLPAMEKAGAIVTDEGGITCHAAIVARELKKPCVIGTKFATQILKDGMEVEVDADSGVVKILPKHSHLDPNDYVRMFAGKSLIYFLTEIFLGHYGPMGVLSIQDKGKWMSFLPKSIKEKTLLHGKELYTSKEKYTQYKKEFDDYIRDSSEYFERVLNKEKLSEEDIRKFFELASKHFYYYSQTEFFYTDLLKPEEMAISVQEFDKLKLDGRSHLNKILFEEEGYVRRLIKNISQNTGVSEKELMNHSVAEIIDLVANAKKIEKDVTEKRDTFFSSHSLTLVWDEAKHLIERFFAPYQGISSEIRGTIANKGKVRGKARVMIPDFSNFEATKKMVEEMEEGEILVAETTAPEIIQACHKAAAIITNQGGMLSHAAIISRELNIPCIIGTDKEVTLNIKTGDELEVDANEGIIRILR